VAISFYASDFGILLRSCARKIMKIRQYYSKKISGTFLSDTVYINDLADMDTGDYRTDCICLLMYLYLFADDAKICRHITCTDDYQILQ